MKLAEPMLFRGAVPVSGMDLRHASDVRRAIAAHSGHFALHERASDGSHLLVRDLVGVHKLFFALGEGALGDTTIETSSLLVDLLRAGHPFSSVFSVPAGHYLHVDPRTRAYELVRWGRIPFARASTPDAPTAAPALAPFAECIREALQRTFRMVAKRCAGRPVYVTLSGGLDSTTIAALAREHFDDARAVTFALRGPRQDTPGSDLRVARRVAGELGLPHVEVLSEGDEVVELLDEVLIHGQDPRDFNVHCGLVNAAIGKALAARHPRGPRPVVLTGDAMNELLADYAPVHFRGREYFGLPALDRGRLRRFLVGGLDAGDREVGIFARFGVETLQPYALCAREYAALPAQLACESGSKSKLVQAVMGARVPGYVLARPKVRAQVAVEGEPAGTLALLVERGIDQEHLNQRFMTLLGIDRRSLGELTRAGHYRFSTTFPASPARGRISGSTLRARSALSGP